MTKRMTIESLLKVFPSYSDKARGADRPPSFIPKLHSPAKCAEHTPMLWPGRRLCQEDFGLPGHSRGKNGAVRFMESHLATWFCHCCQDTQGMEPLLFIRNRQLPCCISPALGVFYSEGISGG